MMLTTVDTARLCLRPATPSDTDLFYGGGTILR